MHVDLEFRDFMAYSEILGECFSLYEFPALTSVYVFLGLCICILSILYFYFGDNEFISVRCIYIGTMYLYRYLMYFVSV